MSVATTADLNLRKGAGTSSPVVTLIPSGTIITVTGDPWYPVNVGGKSGWVSGKYLDFDAPEPTLTPAQLRFPSVADTYLGCLYRWGGNGPDRRRYGDDKARFDCSGYTYWVLGDMGFVEGRTKTSADHQMRNFRTGVWPGQLVTGDLQPGDVMFFGASKSKATHVTFALGDGTLIGANGGNALTRTVADAQKRNAKVDIRPVDYRRDLIGIWRPEYRV